MRIIVGITGSSGALYAVDFLKRCPGDKYLVTTKWGRAVLKDEAGLGEKDLAPHVKAVFSNDDLTAPIASGSNHIDAMVIIPCSTSTVGKIASGIGDSLLTRAAQVTMKERGKLILCIRETPLATNTLRQLADLSRDGVIIMPVSPPMYTRPETIDQAIAGFVDKVLHLAAGVQTSGWRSEELE